MSIHHIDMDPVPASFDDGVNFLTEPRKVGGQNGRRDSNGLLHDSDQFGSEDVFYAGPAASIQFKLALIVFGKCLILFFPGQITIPDRGILVLAVDLIQNSFLSTWCNPLSCRGNWSVLARFVPAHQRFPSEYPRLVEKIPDWSRKSPTGRENR
jgi:hypothetical protein